MSEWLTWQLVDSAFPTGTFAHSWGLESAWQHGEVTDLDSLRQFLHDSIRQTGYATIPLLNAVYRRPDELERLDELAEAFLLNPVANRASRAQGRALVATVARIWPSEDMAALKRRVESLRAHAAPLSGAVFRIMGVSLSVAQHVTLYSTARSVLAAAVRLGISGSYEAQRLQYGCAAQLDAVIQRCGALTPDDLAQTAPIADMLQSAHDRLYSRLFQS